MDKKSTSAHPRNPKQRSGSSLLKQLPPILFIFILLTFFTGVIHVWADSVIDFETLPDGSRPGAGDRVFAYPDLGVSFDDAVVIVRCDPDPVTRRPEGNHCGGARSGSHAVQSLPATEFQNQPIEIQFEEGQPSATAYVRYNGGEAHDGKEVTVVMEAWVPTDPGDPSSDLVLEQSETITFTHNIEYESDGSGGSTERIISGSTWHEISVGDPFPLPAPGATFIRVWGGLSESIGSPPQRSRASNFLFLDDLSVKEESPAPSDDEAPNLTFLDPPDGSTFTDFNRFNTHIRVEDNKRLASVDLQVSHDSGTVTTEFTGGNVCGGGAAEACPERVLDEEFTTFFNMSLPGGYTVTVEACDAAGNCVTDSLAVNLNLTPPDPLISFPAFVEVNQGVQTTRGTQLTEVLGAGTQDRGGCCLEPGKDTVVRWYLFGDGGSVPDFSARMSIIIENQDGSETRIGFNPNTARADVDVPAAPGSARKNKAEWEMRTDLDQTLNFVIPGSELENAKHIYLRLESTDGFTTTGGTGRIRFSFSGERNVLGLNFVTVGGPASSAVGTPVTCAQAANTLIPYLKKAYPVADVVQVGCQRLTGMTAAARGFNNNMLLRQTFNAFGGDDAPSFAGAGNAYVVTLGVVTNMPDGTGGLAYRPCKVKTKVLGTWKILNRRTAVSVVNGDLAAEEIGHTLGLVHLSNDHGEGGGGRYHKNEPENAHGAMGWEDMGVIAVASTPPGPGNRSGEWNLTLVDPRPGATGRSARTSTPPPANHTHDFMSYGGGSSLGPVSGTEWASWMTYEDLARTKPWGGNSRHKHRCTKLGQITSLGQPLAAAAGVPQPLEISAQEAEGRVESFLIGGDVLEDGSIVLDPLLHKQIPQQMLNQLTPAGQESSGEAASEIYTLNLLDAEGNIVVEQPLVVLDFSHQGGNKFIETALPYRRGIERLVIREDNDILVDKQASPHAPRVRVTSPEAGGTYPAGEVTVRWEASDPDGDPLTFLVQYSPDDGRSWQGVTLVQGPPYQATIEVGDMIAGQRAYIRVTASDGFNTAVDHSDAFFSLGTGQPPVDDTPSAQALEVIPGDVNQDGRVSLSDPLNSFLSLFGLVDLSRSGETAADVYPIQSPLCGDGNVGFYDIFSLLRSVLLGDSLESCR